MKKTKTKIFCDIAELKQIKKFNKKKIVKGFTTNPSLMRKAGAKDYKTYSKKILKICKNKLNHLKFILMSDHGSKIQGTNYFSSILAYRDKYTQYEIINDKITVQSFLKNKFDN